VSDDLAMTAWLALALATLTALPPAPSSKIAPWVLERTEGGRESEFLVVLADQADLGGAETLATKREKGAFVHRALLARAERSQAPLLALLRARGVPHQPFVVVNAIRVTGTRETALALAERPEVARIEGNPRVRGLEPPPAPEPESPSPLAPAAVELGVSYVNAPAVWGLGFTGQGIVIAGLDTGVQWDHPALKARYRGWNGVSASHNYNWHDAIHSGGGDCGANAAAPCDDNNHGTHTIGTAVGTDGSANQIGVAPGAKWIGCRNMDQGNGTPTTYLECLEFLLAPYPLGGTTAQGDPSKAPDVSTNSWACPPSEGCSTTTLASAIASLRAAGIFVVGVAGNGGPSCSTVSDPPGIYDQTYTVGAFNAGGATPGSLASFSGRGPVTVDGSNRPKPDITAPGVSVRSAVRGSAYSALSGTSMAAPHVAGVVALLWSKYPAYRGHVAATESILNASATDVSIALTCSASGVPNNLYGWGRVDAKAAYDLAAPCASVANGDANGDGVLSVADIFAIINRLFAGGSAPVCFSDVNGDGRLDVSDVFYLINALFAGGPPPV
jgi:subtilisin family serine protease